MKRRLAIFLLLAWAVPGPSGCNRAGPEVEAVDTLRIGIIAPLSGPGRSWGEATLRCARVIEDYHNRRGGVEIGGTRRRVALLPEDDRLSPDLARNAAKRLVAEDGVHAVIGPLGDDAAVAAAPILDGYGVPYLHYGFDTSLLREDSLGMLGMPLPGQTLPVLFDYLRTTGDYERVLVIAKDSEEALQQKRIAEEVAAGHGFELLRISEFDIREETCDLDLPSSALRVWARRLVAAGPDLILFTGLAPGEMPTAAAYLDRAGFEGALATQNSQDSRYLKRYRESSDNELFFVGGRFPGEERSEYYRELREDYVERYGEPSEEFDTKLYALEMLLLLFREGGSEALRSPSTLGESFAGAVFIDPFFTNGRELRLVSGDAFEARRQLSVPVVISRLKSGALKVVHYGGLNE